jgi:hypothetical protein
MQHDEAVRLQMTEQYLLNELSPEARAEFEEHYFECHECAVDVGAGATFVEQSKIILAEKPEVLVAPVPVPPPWWAWFRPAVVVPVMTMLLAVVGYQNLVLYPQLQQAANQPQVMPFANLTVGTFGSNSPVIEVGAGQGFVLLLRIPPQDGYASYTANLYDPSQKVEWSVTIPSASVHNTSSHDQWALRVPGARRPAGTYTVAVRGEKPDGGSEEVRRASFELQIQ